MKAIILAIGNELTSGRHVDTNSAYIAERLATAGVHAAAHFTVGDDRSAIAEALAGAAGAAELVIATGGLGPTPDDLTRQGLADAMGCELAPDAASLAMLEDFFAARGYTLSETNRVQAMLPAGAEPLPNRHGTAPGILAPLGEATVVCLPGVPHEMRAIFDEHVLPRFAGRAGVIVRRELRTFGMPESELGAKLADLMTGDGDTTIGTAVKAGVISVSLQTRAESVEAASAVLSQAAAAVRNRLGEAVFGEGDETLASAVGQRLAAAGETLATAESCTGGLIGKLLTDVPGSSEYYLGGVVAYADDVKQSLLDVPGELLAAHGAVSEQVAAAMAEGCRRRFGSDWALAATGIAGPTGGTADKPVGLVHFALTGPDGTTTQCQQISGTREIVRTRAACAAVNMLRLALMEGQ